MLWIKIGIGILSFSMPAAVFQPEPRGGCLDLVWPNSRATVSGTLTRRLFAGPPNYESIANGDAEEWSLILELPRPICANDAEFIGPETMFDRVHLSSDSSELRAALRAAVGRNVTVTGEAFGAQTGHHHAPLVLFVERLATR
jgi:hypothetical protein